MASSISSETFNILLIGKTGMGKSSTGNKLLGITDQTIHDPTRESPIQPPIPGLNKCEKPYFLTAKDSADSCTRYAKCLKNCSTNVYVLDSPGLGDTSLASKPEQTIEKINFEMFRRILKFQMILKPFNCILYFLPVRMSLEKSDAYIMNELRLLTYFLNKEVFESLVVAVTRHPHDNCTDPIPHFMISETERNFQTCLSRLTPTCSSKPPCIFIGKDESGALMLEKIQNASKSFQPINIRFLSSNCLKCPCRIISHNKAGDGAVSLPPHDQENRIPYEKSRCHPWMIPKFTKFRKVFGTIMQISTLGIPTLFEKLFDVNVLPTILNEDEICVCCKQAPGSQGCVLVQLNWKSTHDGISYHIQVDHSASNAIHPFDEYANLKPTLN